MFNSDGFVIYDTTVWSAPVEKKTVSVSASCTTAAISSNSANPKFMVVACRNKLVIYDISSRLDPKVKSELKLSETDVLEPTKVLIDNNAQSKDKTAYVAV